MLNRILRRLRIAYLQGRVDVLGQVMEELAAVGRDTHRVARLRVESMRELVGLQAAVMQERIHAAF